MKKSSPRNPKSAAAVSLSDRVAKSREALEARGGVRLPTGWLQPDAARALHYLHTHRYDPTRVGCISRALVDAAEKLRKRGHKKP